MATALNAPGLPFCDLDHAKAVGDAERILRSRIDGLDCEGTHMRGLVTATGRDGWLAALIATCDSISENRVPASERTLADAERHLRDNARINAAGSRLFH